MNSSEIPPIKRSISVSWSPETAFRRFTEEFGSWWPSRTHSIGGERIKQLVFEQHEGGRIYEEHMDGRRFQWGQVTLWEPEYSKAANQRRDSIHATRSQQTKTVLNSKRLGRRRRVGQGLQLLRNCVGRIRVAFP